MDSNVFIKDPWLRSQRIRALLDYLTKTPYRMVLSEVVEVEVRARRRREFEEKAAGAAASLAKGRKAGVIGLPDLDARGAVEKTMRAWESRWDEVVDAASARRVGVRAEDAAEAARRAAFREAPCSPEGEGMRDALIWLALVADAADSEGGSGEHGLAFISENTKDLAASDGRSLREGLLGDVRGQGSRLSYYASLDDFLRERAEPVAHITTDWVLSRVRVGRLEELVREQVRSGRAYGAFRITDPARRRLYETVGDPKPESVDLRLGDFYVWQFGDGHAELRMSFDATVVASIECVNLPDFQISEFTGSTYWEDEEDKDNPLTLVLECSAAFVVRAGAHVENDGLSEPVLEGILWP